jgi:hypothetical protein
MKIQIRGWPSFEAWREAGYPGAVSFDAQGNRKGAPKTQLAKCRVNGCGNVMNRDGYCIPHFAFYRRARRAS